MQDQAPTLTIRLLHERRSGSPRRKIDGRSGKVYCFLWRDEHSAYCYTTASSDEVADLFESQGRSLGSYFAPVIEAPKKPAQLPDHLLLALLKNEIDPPTDCTLEGVARALVETFERGVSRGRELQRAEAPAAAFLKNVAPAAATAPAEAEAKPQPEAPAAPIPAAPETRAPAEAQSPSPAETPPSQRKERAKKPSPAK